MKLTITDEAGNAEEVTTGDDGKWSLQVKKEGPYTVALQEDSLPDGTAVSGKSEITVQAKFAKTVPALIRCGPRRTSPRRASSTS